MICHPGFSYISCQQNALAMRIILLDYNGYVHSNEVGVFYDVLITVVVVFKVGYGPLPVTVESEG